jgi:16S rRNA processing protein RimM
VTAQPSRLRAAYVRRPHGVDGEVRAEPIGGDAQRFRRGLRLRTEPGQRELSVRSVRDGGDGTVLLSFAGVDTPQQARDICARYLTVSAAEARPLGDNEWFVWQLRGLRAVTNDGRELGVVDDIESGVANDVLVLRAADSLHRLPMVRSFVESVDLSAGTITVAPQEEVEA